MRNLFYDNSIVVTLKGTETSTSQCVMQCILLHTVVRILNCVIHCNVLVVHSMVETHEHGDSSPQLQYNQLVPASVDRTFASAWLYKHT